MKSVLILILIHIFAYSAAKAETTAVVGVASAADECKIVLPQVESDYQELDQKYRTLSQDIVGIQENYLVSFNQMTSILFQMTQAREEETQKISQSRDQLRDSLQKFNDQKTEESSKLLQDNYLDLTVRLYSALMDSQKILETLKTQLSQVENSRSQFSNSRKDLEDLDRQKLAVEAKLINLKIKCRSDRKYQ